MLAAIEPVIQAFLALASGLLPTLGVNSGAVVAQIITGLEAALPVIFSLGSKLYTEVQGIIASLQNGATPLTPPQIASLAAMNAQCDAAFEVDAVAAGAAPQAASST